MDRRTLLAVVLSVVVITAGFVIQNALFPIQPTQPPVAQTTSQTSSNGTGTSVSPAPSVTASGTAAPATGLVLAKPQTDVIPEQTYSIKTNLFSVTFTNKGGDVTSIQLLKHKEGDKYVEMLFSGAEPAHAFALYYGSDVSKPIDDTFNYRVVNATTVEFYRDFVVKKADGTMSPPFTVIKKYAFNPDEYMFDVTVTMQNSVNEFIPLNFNGAAYTLGFAPQIGPKFQKLSQNYEYRKYYTYYDGKRHEEKVPQNGLYELKNRVAWAALVGKYFTVIGIPDATPYSIRYSQVPVAGLPSTSSLFFSRPIIQSSNNIDAFRFYVGPKTANVLSIYNKADQNDLKVSDYNLDKVMDTSAILGWLEAILKFSLIIIYKVVPNYGIAIILLTLVVKIIFFPLTKKSSESTTKMQELSPKIKELQEKYKTNPEKLNKEMAELYKKAGTNPLGGCLPMLLQIPIFFAMYNLFNTNFDLRGASFIPGWIGDLSSPESVWSFAPFKLPLLGWSDVRLLPFIYLFSQLLSGKMTQTPESNANSSMKLMIYFMPIMFFFILYDVPSGLLIYWIATNFLSTIQQLYINSLVKRKEKK